MPYRRFNFYEQPCHNVSKIKGRNLDGIQNDIVQLFNILIKVGKEKNCYKSSQNPCAQRKCLNDSY